MLDYLLWIALICLFVLLLYVSGTRTFKTWKNLGVPGPDPVPFFGNAKDLYDVKSGVCANIKRWQSVYGRVIGVYLFHQPTLIVTDKELLKLILVKEFNNFSNRSMAAGGELQQSIIKKGVFFDGGNSWQRIRRIMTPAFSTGKIKLVINHVNRTARRLADNCMSASTLGKRLQAKHIFSAFSLDVIAGTAFGLDLDLQSEPESLFMTHARKIIRTDKTMQLKATVGNIMFPIVDKIFKLFDIGLFNQSSVEYFQNQMYALIDERKAHPDYFKQMDIMHLLMNAEADASEEIVGSKKLTREEVAAQGIVFIIAGYETSSTTLQYLSYELARHPDIQVKVLTEIQEVIDGDNDPCYDDCQNLKYTEAVINEALRMYPPLHIINRKALHDIDLMGQFIPANSNIYVPLFNIGRDPDYFEEPDTFKPDRFLGENKHQIDSINFLPFGFGPRQCIGMRLAILLLKISLVHVLRRVEIVDVFPKSLQFEDFSGLLIPRVPIELVLRTRV